MYIIIYKVINISCVFTNSTNVNKICTNLFNYIPNSLKLTYSYNSNYYLQKKKETSFFTFFERRLSLSLALCLNNFNSPKPVKFSKNIYNM